MSTSLADLFRQISAGVYVVGVAHQLRRDAFTASAVMHVSYKPLLVGLAINAQHRSYAILSAGRAFTINVLGRDQLALARHFGGDPSQEADRLVRHELHEGIGGAPIFDDALCYFECNMVSDMPAGDHRFVLGEVVAGGRLDHLGAPMLYRDTGNIDGSASLFPAAFNQRSDEPERTSRTEGRVRRPQ